MYCTRLAESGSDILGGPRGSLERSSSRATDYAPLFRKREREKRESFFFLYILLIRYIRIFKKVLKLCIYIGIYDKSCM